MAVMNPYNYGKPSNFNKVRTVAKKQNPAAERKLRPVENGNQDASSYLEQKIMAAKPEELTYMLYEGIIKFLKKAKYFMAEKDIERTHNAFMRAQAIITELRSTLNMDYEISGDLDKLYEFMNATLMEANIEKDATKVDDVIGLVDDLRVTWKEAMKIKE